MRRQLLQIFTKAPSISVADNKASFGSPATVEYAMFGRPKLPRIRAVKAKVKLRFNP